MSKPTKPMMKCGHAANAKKPDGSPVCVICIGIKPEAEQVADEPPKLDGRTAKCAYCKSTVPSDTRLAFFEHKPEQPQDRYYCGCHGWD